MPQASRTGAAMKSGAVQLPGALYVLPSSKVCQQEHMKLMAPLDDAQQVFEESPVSFVL